MVCYYWQESWNREGFIGLKPRFAGGRPSRLSEEQNVELRSILEKRYDWTTEEVRKMLKKMGMHYSKHYQHDYRRPRNAEDILKKLR